MSSFYESPEKQQQNATHATGHHGMVEVSINQYRI